MKKVKQSLSLFLVLVTAKAFTQDILATGTIFEHSNKILKRTNTIQMGTANGTACDRNGKFEIAVPEGEHTLQLAFPVTNRTSIRSRLTRLPKRGWRSL